MSTAASSDRPAALASVQRDLAREIDRLPRLSAVLERFLDRAQNDCATIATITSDLEADPSIASWILRQARSGFYAQSRPIADIGEACVVLGLQTVTQLAYAACSRDLLLHPPGPYPGTPRGAWLHGLAVGTAAARLAEQLADRSPVPPEVARVAGLIHDLGKQLVVARWPASDRGPVTCGDQERAAVGFDHATASAALAATWKLPAELIQAIATHHEPAPSAGGILIATADRLMVRWQVGTATYPRFDREPPLEALQAMLAPLTDDGALVTRWCEDLVPVVQAFDEMLRWSQRPEPPDLAEAAPGVGKLREATAPRRSRRPLKPARDGAARTTKGRRRR